MINEVNDINEYKNNMKSLENEINEHNHQMNLQHQELQKRNPKQYHIKGNNSNSKIDRTEYDRIRNLSYNKYKNYALDIFRWTGLPNGIKSRYIEEMLFDNGQCFFYEDPALGFVVFRNTDIGQPDIYGEYDEAMLTSPNGRYNKPVKTDIGIKILNNDLKTPTQDYIYQYAMKMADIEETIRVNIMNQKYPYIIQANKKNQKTLENLYTNIQLGRPAILVGEDLDVNNVMVHMTQTPFVSDKLNMLRYELERSILTFLGINNSIEKNNRLLVDEINSNNEFIERNVQIQLKNRQEAVEEINKKFGLNIKVEKVNTLIEDELFEKQMKLNGINDNKEGEFEDE